MRVVAFRALLLLLTCGARTARASCELLKNVCAFSGAAGTCALPCVPAKEGCELHQIVGAHRNDSEPTRLCEIANNE